MHEVSEAGPQAPSLAGYRALVVTVSDRCSRGEQQDLSGPRVAAILRAAGSNDVSLRIVSDDREPLQELLAVQAPSIDLILTTGGTGVAPRDTTPEATLAVGDRIVPGLGEIMRADGLRQTPFAALGRGVAVICGRCLIVNLPGSPRGAESSLRAILPLLPHALALLAGDAPHADSDGDAAIGG